MSHVELLAESWWAPDGSGRIDVSKAQNYGIHGGMFGAGTFPTEGDLTGFPTDPDALRTFLLERSAARRRLTPPRRDTGTRRAP